MWSEVRSMATAAFAPDQVKDFRNSQRNIFANLMNNLRETPTREPLTVVLRDYRLRLARIRSLTEPNWEHLPADLKAELVETAEEFLEFSGFNSSLYEAEPLSGWRAIVIRRIVSAIRKRPAKEANEFLLPARPSALSIHEYLLFCAYLVEVAEFTNAVLQANDLDHTRSDMSQEEIDEILRGGRAPIHSD